MMWHYLGTCCGDGVTTTAGLLRYYSDDTIDFELRGEEITMTDASEVVQIDDSAEVITLTETDEIGIGGGSDADITITDRGDGICDD